MVAAIAVEAPEEVLDRTRPQTADFEAVYRRHGRSLYGTALRMLRRSEEAEDAVQDAFLAYHQSAPGLTEEQAGAWLHRVVINRCLDRLRGAKRWKSAELTEDMADRPGTEGLGIDLESAVARLPEKARAIFLLHDVEGLKHRELGELLGLSEGTTKSQLFRARQMLRRFIRGRR